MASSKAERPELCPLLPSGEGHCLGWRRACSELNQQEPDTPVFPFLRTPSTTLRVFVVEAASSWVVVGLRNVVWPGGRGWLESLACRWQPKLWTWTESHTEPLEWGKGQKQSPIRAPANYSTERKEGPRRRWRSCSGKVAGEWCYESWGSRVSGRGRGWVITSNRAKRSRKLKTEKSILSLSF